MTGPNTSPSALTEEFLVAGMTCQHCVSSVVAGLGGLDAVQSVTVDLNAGGVSRVLVTSSNALDPDVVRSTVTAAGYELVTVRPGADRIG